MTGAWLIEKLNRHDRSSFDCGDTDLNRFVREFARQNQKENIGRTYVAVKPGDSRVLGFFTLTVGSVQRDFLGPAGLSLPRYPVPVVRVGRLGVDVSAQGTGLGERLLVRAMEVALQVSDVVGILAIEVQAKGARAKLFYERYGFEQLLDDELHLYLSIKSVRKALK